MSWSVKLTRAAQEDLNALDKRVRERVLERLAWLEENFDDITPLPLTGEFRGFYKLRIGDWRAFYKINWENKIIFVVYIDHRSSAYK